jgi:flagellar motor switch protein FliG
MAAAKPTINDKEKESEGLSDAVKAELETLTATERAAVIMLLLGEQQAADCIRYLSPREVQSLGACMVSVVDLSQEAVNVVLDDFLSTIKKQTSTHKSSRLSSRFWSMTWPRMC